MRWPQLWSRDLDGLIRWVEEVLANVAQNPQEESEASPTAGSDADLAGTAKLWYGAEPPKGWTWLNGTYLFVSEAPDLFSVVGYNFDPAPPPNMFKLPPAPTGAPWIIRR